MKSIALPILSFFSFLLFAGLEGNKEMAGKCKAKEITEACRPNLKPFKYDSYAYSELQFDNATKTVDVDFTVFASQKYKIIFCASGFEEMVKVYIYDKPKTYKKRKKVYDNENGIDNLFWSFQTAKAGTYFIEYEVPPAKDGKKKKGCIVMIVGFK